MALVSLISLVASARSGKLVSFPTDTVPALAVRPDRSADIFTLKQRSPDKPLILMAASWQEFLPFLDIDHPDLETWQQTAQKYFAGAVTLVLPASDRGCLLNQGFTTLGVRIPDSKIAIAILQQTGAMLTTSANKSNEPPLRKMIEINDAFPSVMTLGEAIDINERSGSGLPSTVVEWTKTGWVVRRQGAVSF
ncbi:MAG: L-threonylcarbamoyladenylate synthase [Pseudanabaena sp.]|nr:L-threonylcarbamoyladenylate synthase [Pseudanabaena sp. M090S1SP2A07QC]MCA6505801.1 L-threonylcarbamoyladenylate synthase [Pseudanabaena sp. M172S2SP2A07QC]MCA6510398.1 L-threonylcarbamoyladenylate synthase [Pseudanabaena sp. M109S1SP2A07QC]MCA6517078.1 L-threonylcarbamoyladenylate synthase [Pseudanabaena sp. M110S1SP2A07QC]MCA6524160.1 L-threonylcarbamoyladenylate synthase [Pseudanabaena sp. M051S1SP2A07QC]MCA6524564.1 L-threonylcarbamoyladenylate synthase [Pseudanabaena sp. M179S2SP2A07Q